MRHPRVTHEGAALRLRKHYSLVHNVGFVSAIAHILGTDPSSGAKDVVVGSVAAPRHKPEYCTLGNSSAFPCHQATRLCWAGMACRNLCSHWSPSLVVSTTCTWHPRPPRQSSPSVGIQGSEDEGSYPDTVRATDKALLFQRVKALPAKTQEASSVVARLPALQGFSVPRPCLAWCCCSREPSLPGVGKQTLAPVGEACTVTGRRRDAC